MLFLAEGFDDLRQLALRKSQDWVLCAQRRFNFDCGAQHCKNDVIGHGFFHDDVVVKKRGRTTLLFMLRYPRSARAFMVSAIACQPSRPVFTNRPIGVDSSDCSPVAASAYS